MSEKNIHEPKTKSEWNMAIQDITRIDAMLQTLDVLAVRVNQGDKTCIYNYFLTIKQIYKNMKPLLLTAYAKKMDDKFDKLMQIMVNTKFGKKGVTWEIISDLEKMENRVRTIRQQLGLGLPTQINLSKRGRLSKAVE